MKLRVPLASALKVASGKVLDRKILVLIRSSRTFSGSSSLGNAQEQAKDELRKAVAWSQVLLRQEHHTQDCRQKVSAFHGKFCAKYQHITHAVMNSWMKM